MAFNDPVTVAFLIAGLIVALGSLSTFLFRRTGVPDMIFLIVLGLLFGPVLRIISPEDIFPLAPYLGLLALIFILFEGGTNLNLHRVFADSPRATILAASGFVISIALSAVFAKYIMGIGWTYGILLGAILGGSSSIVVVSLVSKLKVSEKCSTILTVEASITDILCTVGALTIIAIIIAGLPPIEGLIQQVTAKFSTAAVAGLLVALGWLKVLTKIKQEPYAYMFTYSILFIAYFVVEFLGGSGAFAVLVFAVVLGNDREIFRILGSKNSVVVVDGQMRRFESEMAFLVKTFFFVYLGMILTISNLTYILYGVALSFILLWGRFIAVGLATVRSDLVSERGVMSAALTRGLAAAVLAVIPKQLGLPFADLFATVSIVVIFVTGIFLTIGASIFSHKTNRAVAPNA